MNKDDIKEAINEALTDYRNLGQEVHSDHHDFVTELIVKAKKREELWQKFKVSFIGTVATGFVGFLMWLGTLAIEAFKHGNHP